MDATYFSDFARPGSELRGKPFWAWNGALEPEELCRQIRIFKAMGLGGFFMHSRVGLDTGYLTRDWFDCVRACIAQAEELDMEAWLYDEDRWPSGAAGGIVTKDHRCRRRRLVAEQYDTPAEFIWTEQTVAAFAAEITGPAAHSVVQLERGEETARTATSILAFRVRTEEPSPWFNNQTYLDTMNPEAVKAFLNVTHQAYAAEVGEHFGRSVPGIFTDEPHYGLCKSGQLPWTARLPDAFRERYGYDLIPHLPELVLDVNGEKISRARFHYYDCITHLFTDAFARQVGEWCAEHNMHSTGHVLAEDTLCAQTGAVGSAMRFYEHMQVPGIDVLTERWHALNTAKQCTSIANQFDRPWRLSETNGCTGWDLSFESHKAIGDWQAACGINLRCQHLSWYTMLGQAKRDYPATISYQSPWWELYDKVEGYFARVHAATGRGREVRDLLVVHPIESVWALQKADEHDSPGVHELDRMFHHLATHLIGEHIDFDYGDEDTMARHGRVPGTQNPPALQIGQAVYKGVLVPPLQTIRSTTLKLLREFRDAGGPVVFAGDPPACVDAVRSGQAARFAESCRRAEADGRSAAKAVEDACRRLSISGPDGRELHEVMYLLKEDSDAFYLFVANTGHVPEQWNTALLTRNRCAAWPEVTIRGFADCQGPPIELNPETGERFRADATARDGEWNIKTSLPRIGSRLFLFPKSRSAAPAAPPKKHFTTVDSQEINPEQWPIVLSDSNCLVLDRPRCRIGDAQEQGPEEILRIDARVRDELGLEHRGGRMVQPWAREKGGHAESVPVRLTYAFRVEDIPTGEFKLAVEEPAFFDITLNGCPVNTDAVSGWWVDKSLKTIPLDPALLHHGKNTLELCVDYNADFSGLEIIYLLGRFGVTMDHNQPVLRRTPETLHLGDWCEQGLSFYSGSVCYRHKIQPELRDGQRLFVKLDRYRGVAVRVLIDGEPAGIAAWEPNEIDVTDLAGRSKGGEVELGLEVIGHRRNSHGPLHINEKWPSWTGPAEFTCEEPRWYEGYQLVPVGLMAAPRLEVREEKGAGPST